MTDRTGQCLCGAVKFKAADMADTFSTCYCDACQRWAGGPYNGVSVPSENLKYEGRAHIGVIKITDFAERAFCKKCGSGIWWRLTRGQYVGKISIPVGLLDDRSGLALSDEMYSDYKDHTNERPEGVAQMTSAEAESIVATFTDEESQ